MKTELRRSAASLLGIGALLLAPVACGTGKTKRDIDRHPEFNTGVSATILSPGGTGTNMQVPPPGWIYEKGTGVPGSYASPQPPPPGYGAPPQARPGGGGGGFSMIGGSRLDEVNLHTGDADPAAAVKEQSGGSTVGKILAAPFLVIAWPFMKLTDAIVGKDDEESSSPAQRAATQPPPLTRQQVQQANEAARLQQLEQQILQQQGAPGPSQGPTYGTSDPGRSPQAGYGQPQYSQPAPSPGTAQPAPRAGGFRSIAEELEALRSGRRGTSAPAPGPQSLVPSAPPRPRAAAPPPVSAAAAPVAERRGLADRVADRDGDGRPDYWAYRENGRLVREVTDADGDGRVDRTVYYDEREEIARIEQDLDHDGQIDSWEQYAGGELARRRVDNNADGTPDEWTWYEGGQIVRNERDTNGDGFRDRIGTFEAGNLVSEREDRNGDGTPDVTVRYDADGRILEKTEDNNGDGVIDVRSYYENGKLARRELLTDVAIGIQ